MHALSMHPVQRGSGSVPASDGLVRPDDNYTMPVRPCPLGMSRTMLHVAIAYFAVFSGFKYFQNFFEAV